MQRVFLILAGVQGLLAVGLGAFGAHGIKARMAGLEDGVQRMQWWTTASQYHLAHALAIGLCAYLASQTSSTAATASGWLLCVGIVLFSGSLYVMTLTGVRALGAVTPLGGLLLLAGWGAIVWAAVSMEANP